MGAQGSAALLRDTSMQSCYIPTSQTLTIYVTTIQYSYRWIRFLPTFNFGLTLHLFGHGNIFYLSFGHIMSQNLWLLG